ncbi:S1C family serine protease [Aeoliella sp. SH292]|uniref:S1C family serine protease n=1 Tax=Aeoliella sp. SH292 TaxID=3454464 RepID=UPI003F9510E4
MKFMPLLLIAILAVSSNTRAEVPPEVLEAEAARVAVVEKISRSTVAIFDSKGQGGGSGVIISPDGYALTNFHVTAPCGPAMKVGLNDGKLYDAVLVGLDPPGDVALIKLLGRDDFPTAELGDSDTAQVGDSVIVAGNPFLLAEDYHPTITFGILSGTHRYQYPAGTLLEYADCLQTDASINPGNSGGPLWDAEGRLIGINGRGSFEKRGRVNVGVGYAISINQIKHFLSHLKSGRVVDHATLGATVASAGEGRVAIDDLLDDSDAYRRGIRYGDYLSSFAGRDITTANVLKNVLGIYPAGWRVPVEFVRDGQVFEANVRLASLHGEGELETLIEQEAQNPPDIQPPAPPEEKPEGDEDKSEDADKPKLPRIGLPEALAGVAEPKLPPEVEKLYEKRSGFANYYFNRQAQEQLAADCPEWGAFDATKQLVITGVDSLEHEVLAESSAKAGSLRSVRGQFFADFTTLAAAGDGPPGSGGMMAAVHQWHKLLGEGSKGFDEAFYLGQLPFGAGLRLHDCLVTIDEGYTTHFYFDPDTKHLVGMEHFTADDLDPCTIQFSRFEKWQGAELPKLWVIRFGDNAFMEFEVTSYEERDAAAAAPEAVDGKEATDD